MPYYLVKCKCGHVGKKYYMPITFAVEASSKKEASAYARTIRRVKHDHKDAILECIEVSYEDYLNQKEINENDIYLKCHSRHEQNEYLNEIKDRLIVDPNWIKKNNLGYKNRKPNLSMQKKKYEETSYLD